MNPANQANQANQAQPSAIPMPWKWSVAYDLEILVLQSTPDSPEGKTRVEATLGGCKLPEFWIADDVRLVTPQTLKVAIERVVEELLREALGRVGNG